MKSLRSMHARVGSLLRMGILVIAMVGCSDGTGPEAHAGTYDMQSFSGSPLPATDGTLRVYSGVLTLRSDGTFQMAVESDLFDEASQGWIPNPIMEQGTFTIQGIYLNLSMDGGGELAGRVSHGFVTLQDGTPGSYWVRRG